MFTDPYIEALLVDPQAADQVWELWDAELISDDIAALAWLILASQRFTTIDHHGENDHRLV